MSSCTHESMINHHGQGLFAQVRAQVGETLHVWRRRYEDRCQLAQWSDRDLHDIGMSWSDIAHEADKPFWRA